MGVFARRGTIWRRWLFEGRCAAGQFGSGILGHDAIADVRSAGYLQAMNHYIILIGVADNLNLGDDAESDRCNRLSAIVELIFSLGPAWHGSQTSVLLNSEVDHEAIIERVTPLLGDADFVGVIEIEAKSVAAIGWNPDEEGLDRLYPNIAKWAVSPPGRIYLKK